MLKLERVEEKMCKKIELERKRADDMDRIRKSHDNKLESPNNLQSNHSDQSLSNQTIYL